jgi:hypothetical protein
MKSPRLSLARHGDAWQDRVIMAKNRLRMQSPIDQPGKEKFDLPLYLPRSGKVENLWTY